MREVVVSVTPVPAAEWPAARTFTLKASSLAFHSALAFVLFAGRVPCLHAATITGVVRSEAAGAALADVYVGASRADEVLSTPSAEPIAVEWSTQTLAPTTTRI